MNKAKRVAWHKHLAKAKKYKEKQRLAKASGTGAAPSTATKR